MKLRVATIWLLQMRKAATATNLIQSALDGTACASRVSRAHIVAHDLWFSPRRRRQIYYCSRVLVHHQINRKIFLAVDWRIKSGSGFWDGSSRR